MDHVLLFLLEFSRDPKNLNMKTCSCSSIISTDVSNCPSRGCAEFMSYVKEKYGIRWEQVKWGYFDSDNFLVGPFGQGMQKNIAYQRMILNSYGPDKNSICCGNTEKTTADWSTSGKTQKWQLYKCKTCNVWTHALCLADNKVAVVLNNPVCNFYHITQ